MSAPDDADSILAALRRLGDGPSEMMTLGEIVTRLDARAHALVLFLLAAPNLTPGPSIPGFSTLFGLPLCVVAFEMALGRRALRLPRFLARIEIRRVRVVATVARLAPLLHRVEGWLTPRLASLTRAERTLGGACVVLGALLALPIPVYSMLPAVAVMAIALGLLLRDGAAVAVGLALGVASAAVLVALAYLVHFAVEAG
jgi:hypothetical protein